MQNERLFRVLTELSFFQVATSNAELAKLSSSSSFSLPAQPRRARLCLRSPRPNERAVVFVAASPS